MSNQTETQSTEPAIEPRRCMVILHGQCDECGYIPSLVVEGEAGHSPMVGRGVGASPWYWGKTYDEAEAVCAKYNRETFGLDAVEALKIVASSMFAHRRPRQRREA